jgi:hypothetical protein
MSQPPAGDLNRTPDFQAPGYQHEPAPDQQPTPAPLFPDAITGLASPELAAEPAVAAVENVGRGILFSLVSIPLGAALTVGVWQLGFVASITALAGAVAATWLYAKGAGAAPSKGAAPLIAVIVAGVAASAVGVIASDALRYLAEEYPGLPVSDQVTFVMENLGDAGVWQAYGGDFAMLSLFAALGTFGVIRQLGRAKKV